MHQITTIERDAFVWMQGRMIELLLRYDVSRFTKTFNTHAADQVSDVRLQPYRDMAVLFHLRDELFESILPRIKRRLSFAAPREILTEELPPRGRIDWSRTAAANLRDRPTELPLEVQTRQRRRHFSMPENMLTVATILECRNLAEHLLDAELERQHTSAVTHPLNDLVEQCTRELSFLQFATLVRPAEEIIGGYATTTLEELEAAVEDNLLPGHNSAYDDLLAWRRSFYQLALLDRTHMGTVLPMLGANPKEDDYLYQTWLFYEFGDMLQHRNALDDWNVSNTIISFTWGAEGAQQAYELRHDRGVKDDDSLWMNAPGVRPDLYIVRKERQQVEANGQVIWREPSYVLDAKYYRPREDKTKPPSEPIKRMIADLQLMGERHGALLFAFHSYAPDTEGDAAAAQGITVQPISDKAQYTQSDVGIRIWRLQPLIAESAQIFQAYLQSIFEDVYVSTQPVAIACHGVFLDTLSANAHGVIASTSGLKHRNGEFWEGDIADIVVCPKPHIAPWRVDLVSLSQDCCKKPALCHIMGRQPAPQKPRRLAALEDITEAIRLGTASDEEETIKATTAQVLAITKRYAELLQPNIQEYKLWIRAKLEVDDVFDTTLLLNDTQRETLALARFLWEQVDHIKASNFAGPTLLFTGVLEEMTRAAFYNLDLKLCNERGYQLPKTLGTLGNAKDYGGANWQILQQKVSQAGYWREQVTKEQSLSLSKWIDNVKDISFIRNKAAHEAYTSKQSFLRMVSLYFGSSLTGIGLVNGLLLAWKQPSK